MNILIFGRGKIAEREYLPKMIAVAERLEPTIELRVQCVDRNKDHCFGIDSWQNDAALHLDEIDKILVLSTPDVHFENVSAIARRYAFLKIPLPEIYIEKPIYLQSEIENWTKLLLEYSSIEERTFYIDHYRFKDSVARFLERRVKTLRSIGRLCEIAFVSLERKPFWDSTAFSHGYFLEHGCHVISMLDRVFPGVAKLRWIPQRTNEWRVWEQIDRPMSCKGDSACVMFVTLAGHEHLDVPEPISNTNITVVLGKGMVDRKVLNLRGEYGSAQVWFNEGKLVVSVDGKQPTTENIAVADSSYARVAECILSTDKDPKLLLSLRQGLAEQEAIVNLKGYFPNQAEKYTVGRIPEEIAKIVDELSIK